MSALVTDQFRILNASNFIESFSNDKNSYYITVGLPNPAITGFGRTSDWNVNPPAPIDNFQYVSHSGDITMFGKKVSSNNVRRLIRRVDYVKGNRYEMYRHDYSILNPSPITNSSRLYDASYYVLNEDFRVYLCIENGSSGENSITKKGNVSQDEPKFTDLEPTKAGDSGDGYIWKYLFSIKPSDIIKFDSTEYITVPNDWESSTDPEIISLREAADSSVNENQIKTVYIEDGGNGYTPGLNQEMDIIGDGTGGKVRIDVDGGKITNTVVTNGGKGYTYAMVDLGPLQPAGSIPNPANLIPIIPPSKGHGYDIYTELGADKVLVYARFDGNDKDFPTDTSFAQVSIVKNPTAVGTSGTFYGDNFNSLNAIKFLSNISGTPKVGEKIEQVVTGGKAVAYVASYDPETKVLKYFQDRSLFLNQTTLDTTDRPGISTTGRDYDFEITGGSINGQTSGFSGSIDTGFVGFTTNPTGTKLINLGINFTSGMAVPEINKGSGDVIFLDNRASIARNARQKEDLKIVLEF